MNAAGLKHFIGDMTEDVVPVVVTFGRFEYRIINAVERDGKLLLVALAEGNQK
jgi:hypothetical protein